MWVKRFISTGFSLKFHKKNNRFVPWSKHIVSGHGHPSPAGILIGIGVES